MQSGCPRNDINLTNPWRTFDNAKGRRPRLSMAHHYLDICLLIPALLRYSLALREPTAHIATCRGAGLALLCSWLARVSLMGCS
jgi:hypothetical protein